MNSRSAWRDRAVAALLHETGTATTRECVENVAGILDSAACDALIATFGHVRPQRGGALDELIPTGARRRAGAFFTPSSLAQQLATIALPRDATGRVVDLSCGDGALLHAALERAPQVEVVGVERELVFAFAAALRLAGRAARIICGDGLAARPHLDGSIAVLGNPPYVGEKGNRALFEQLRADHPDLDPWFGPRIDLHYLFLHRALDILAPGGTLAYLTSEYWLTATGAAALREDLSSRASNADFRRLGVGAFSSAPGHHSLIYSATRRDQDAAGTPDTWHPFAQVARDEAGTPLGDLCEDRQGFVSGADRVTARMGREDGLEAAKPIFLWSADEVPDADRDLFRPIVRRSDCVANRVLLAPLDEDFVLWCDGTAAVDVQARIDRLLTPYRDVLERRREVRNGTMHWSRIWWPRNTVEYARPKLVVPRRAKSPAFCLDLSGSLVSSDCTFLLAPADVDDEIEWLLRVMVATNSPSAESQLRAFGKVKGEIMEFYSAPLRAWRLPIDLDGGELSFREDALEEQFQRSWSHLRGQL